MKRPDVEGEGRRIEFTVKRVKHHVPCPLDEVYFQFASNDDIRSFTINCRLVAANPVESRRDARTLARKQ